MADKRARIGSFSQTPSYGGNVPTVQPPDNRVAPTTTPATTTSALDLLYQQLKAAAGR